MGKSSVAFNMDKAQLELVSLRETIEEAAWVFPNEHLGVGDKFLLRLATINAFDHFSKVESRVPFRSYRFLYWLNEEMKSFGYTGKKMELVP